MNAPETRYVRSGDLNIAYQVVGDGPIDLLHVPGFVSNIELMWDPARGNGICASNPDGGYS